MKCTMRSCVTFEGVPETLDVESRLGLRTEPFDQLLEARFTGHDNDLIKRQLRHGFGGLAISIGGISTLIAGRSVQQAS